MAAVVVEAVADHSFAVSILFLFDFIPAACATVRFGSLKCRLRVTSDILQKPTKHSGST